MNDTQPLPTVDPRWYLQRYPDVARVPLDAQTHYHLYGHRLGRDPSPEFPTAFFRVLLKLSSRKDPLHELRRLAVHGAVPKHALNPGRFLLASDELARTGQLERALELGEQWLPAEALYLTQILRANLAAKREDTSSWLAATNAYLAHFGVSPIHLQGQGSLFDRIQSHAPAQSEGGAKVSIILTAWNSERTVAKALNSLLGQSWKNIEVLVVDDCSSDGTWSVISDIAARDSRVRAWRNAENVGPYVGKSIAASYATGDWITCHDADDWAHPERISRQIRFCSDNRLRACFSGMLRVADNGEFTRFNRAGGFIHDGACRSALVSLFMSSQLFHDMLGAWDQVRAGGDSELHRRLETATGKPVRQLHVPTMLCRDHVESLTNDVRYGQEVRLNDGVLTRVRYRTSYLEGHKALTKYTSRYELPAEQPRFDANDLQVPVDAVVKVTAPHLKQLRQEIIADIVVITSARFPGGNASSTLDEIRYFKACALNVALIHCPADNGFGNAISDRYDGYRDIIHDWSRIARIDAQVLICRQPTILTSHAFHQILPGIQAKYAYVVKNNSRLRPDGTPVYDMAKMVETAQKIQAGSLQFCPISQAMRAQLEQHSEQSGMALRLSELDWTPTFDPSSYFCHPKPSMRAPYAIGRHARDSKEKWRERPDELLQAYPPSSEFEIHILGGADKATDILGRLPENWNVQPFGQTKPLDFLAKLDAFVYFPNSKLVEGFGRTMVEAMIAGVPVIVSSRLAPTFGELVLDCEPQEVAAVIRRLADDADARVAYLSEVQQLAISRYGTDAIAERLRPCGLDLGAGSGVKADVGLTDGAKQYRSLVLGGR